MSERKLWRYPPEVEAWVKENGEGKGFSARELAEMFNRSELSNRTGITMDKIDMSSFLSNHHIRTGWDRKGKYFGPKMFPDGFREWLMEHAEGVPFHDLTERANEHFGTSYSYSQIFSYAKRHKICNSLSTRFRTGVPPWNKGVKGYCAPGCEKGWFKKGGMPPNHLEVGTEIVDTEGYLKVKVGEPHYWMFSHRLVWMREHGDIPEGGIIIFLDGDKKNLGLDNLMLVDRAEHARLNQRRLRFEDGGLTRCAVSLVRLDGKILEKEGGKKRGRRGEVHVLRKEDNGS